MKANAVGEAPVKVTLRNGGYDETEYLAAISAGVHSAYTVDNAYVVITSADGTVKGPINDAAAETLKAAKTAAETAVKQAVATKLKMSVADLENASPEVQAMVAAMVQSVRNAKSMSALAAALGVPADTQISVDSSTGALTLKDAEDKTVTLNPDGIKTEDENGNTVETIKPSDVAPVDTITEALVDGKLTKDVNLASTATISEATVIDMNGHTITGPESGNVFTVSSGSLTLTNGKISVAERQNGIALGGTGAVVNLTDVDISVDSNTSGRALYVSPVGGEKLNIKGGSFSVAGQTSALHVNGTNTLPVEITIDGAEFTSTYATICPIYLAGVNKTTISNTTINGDVGIEIRNGSLTIEDGTVINCTNSTAVEFGPNGNGGTIDSGAGIVVSPHTPATVNLSVKVNAVTINNADRPIWLVNFQNVAGRTGLVQIAKTVDVPVTVNQVTKAEAGAGVWTAEENAAGNYNRYNFSQAAAPQA